MSNENVGSEVVEVAEVKAPRRATVADKDIIKGWQAMALRVNAEGVKNGTVQEVADSLGMLKASLIQRVTSLRGLGISLLKMPKIGVGNRKKDVSKLQELLAEINSELEIS